MKGIYGGLQFKLQYHLVKQYISVEALSRTVSSLDSLTTWGWQIRQKIGWLDWLLGTTEAGYFIFDGGTTYIPGISDDLLAN